MEQEKIVPLAYVPTPSAPYRQHRKVVQLTLQPGRPRQAAHRVDRP